MEFVSSHTLNTAGSAIGITMEGSRPIVIEIEGLSSYTKFGYPKRGNRGIPSSKLDILIAVLNKFGEAKLENYDVYVNVSRGLSIEEP